MHQITIYRKRPFSRLSRASKETFNTFQALQAIKKIQCFSREHCYEVSNLTQAVIMVFKRV